MDLKYFRYFDRSKDYSIILYASSFLSILIVRLMLKEIGYKVWQLKTEFIYRLALKRYAKSLPALSLADRQIVDRLQQEGVYVTSLEKLGFASTPQMVDACSEVLSCTEPERICPAAPGRPHSPWFVQDLSRIGLTEGVGGWKRRGKRRESPACRPGFFGCCPGLS